MIVEERFTSFLCLAYSSVGGGIFLGMEVQTPLSGGQVCSSQVLSADIKMVAVVSEKNQRHF
jgi:hypothetical protein